MYSQTEAWDTSRGIADLLSTSGALHKHPGSHEEFVSKDGDCLTRGLNPAKVVPGTLSGEGTLYLQYLLLDCLHSRAPVQGVKRALHGVPDWTVDREYLLNQL
jgi:hypothetical protein